MNRFVILQENSIMRVFGIVTVLLAAAVTGPSVIFASDPPRTIALVGTDDMKYNVTTITARAGEQIRVRLTVKGTMPKIVMAHNFVLVKLGTNVEKLVTEGAPHRATDFIPPSMLSSVIAKTALAGPGETVDVVFSAPAKPGRYPFLCTFAGHYQSGMKGTLIVK
jgi:azurin